LARVRGRPWNSRKHAAFQGRARRIVLWFMAPKPLKVIALNCTLKSARERAILD
jgi:hypothetical protein